MRARNVVDFSTGAAGAYCSRLLRTVGCKILMAEPIAGRHLRSHGPTVTIAEPGQQTVDVNCLAEYADIGKRSVALDFDSDAGSAIRDQLASQADILVWDTSPGQAVRLEQLVSSAAPGAVVVALSHYGLRGPDADRAGSAFTDWAAGGYSYITGNADGPPRVGGGPWPEYAAGAIAGFTALSAIRHANTDPSTSPSPLVLDISVQDVLVFLHQWTFSLYTHQGVTKLRAGNRHAESFHPMGFLPCSDGWICVGVATALQWERFCLALDMPELLLDPRFDTGARRFDNADNFNSIVAPWLQARTQDEAVRHLQDHGVPASPVQTIDQVAADQQLNARDFWQGVDVQGRVANVPQRPVALQGVGATVEPRRAPVLGQHSRAVLDDLGYDPEQVQDLVDRGLVAAPDC